MCLVMLLVYGNAEEVLGDMIVRQWESGDGRNGSLKTDAHCQLREESLFSS